MKFWYALIAAILFSMLSIFHMEELIDAFVPHQNIAQLQSSENPDKQYGLPNKENQEGKDEEKKENKDSEEDNKEEKDSEEEKRENESKDFHLVLTNNYFYWNYIYQFLPNLTVTREYLSKGTITLDVPLYVLFACLKINC